MSRPFGFNSRIRTSGLIGTSKGFNTRFPAAAGNVAAWAKFNGTSTIGQIGSGVASVMGDVNGSYWYVFVMTQASDGPLMLQADSNKNALRLLQASVEDDGKLQHYVRQSNLIAAMNARSVDQVFDGNEHLVLIQSTDTGTNANAWNQIDSNTVDNDGTENRQAMGINWSDSIILGGDPGLPAFSYYDGYIGYFACGTGELRVADNSGFDAVASAYSSGGREAITAELENQGGTIKFAQILNGVNSADYDVDGGGITWTDVTYEVP